MSPSVFASVSPWAWLIAGGVASIGLALLFVLALVATGDVPNLVEPDPDQEKTNERRFDWSDHRPEDF